MSSIDSVSSFFSLSTLFRVNTAFVAVAIFSLFIANFKRCCSSQSGSRSKSDISNKYLTIVFWHSILITASTPLLRLLYNRWYAPTPLHWLFWFGQSQILVENATTCESDSFLGSFPYPTLAQSPAIDRAFFLHSTFGLTWVIVGHITLMYSHRWGATAHRRMGYAAIFSFATHMGVAVYTLWVDVVKHHPLPRLLLLFNPVMSSGFMLGAIVAAKQGNFILHKNLMLRAYLYSTEGGGTIRQVEHFMLMLGTGPASCQSKDNSYARYCVWSYVARLFLTRMLTLYHLACIARMRQDAKLYRSVLQEVLLSVFASGGLCVVTWVVGLDTMRECLQNWRYALLILRKGCVPNLGAETLRAMPFYLKKTVNEFK